MKKKLLLTACVIGWLSACGDSMPEVAIPYVRVQKVIDLNNFNYQRLKFDKGFVYEDGGYKGLIIYRRDASSYLVFERCCTFKPLEACEKVEVDGSGFFMTDRCCKSQFDFEGTPTGGPAPARLLQYRSSLSGSQLIISN